MINSNKKLASKLGGDRNDQNEFIPYHIQKSKVYGDEYLKESLLKVKKNNLDGSLSDSKSSTLQESIELKAQ